MGLLITIKLKRYIAICVIISHGPYVVNQYDDDAVVVVGRSPAFDMQRRGCCCFSLLLFYGCKIVNGFELLPRLLQNESATSL